MGGVGKDVSELIQFNTPCGMILSGPSSSGKSEFLKKLVKHMDYVFPNPFSSILWCYGEANAVPNELHAHGVPVKFFEGLPSDWSSDELGLISPALIILDDLMEQAYHSPAIAELFTKKNHHCGFTTILVTQNFFYPSKYARLISLNSSYIILTRNFRDKQQFSHLARQIEPHYYKDLQKAHDDALSKRYNYFIIDLHPKSVDALRYRSCIWPTDEALVVWTTPERLSQLKNGESFAFA